MILTLRTVNCFNIHRFQSRPTRASRAANTASNWFASLCSCLQDKTGTNPADSRHFHSVRESMSHRIHQKDFRQIIWKPDKSSKALTSGMRISWGTTRSQSLKGIPCAHAPPEINWKIRCLLASSPAIVISLLFVLAIRYRVTAIYNVPSLQFYESALLHKF